MTVRTTRIENYSQNDRTLFVAFELGAKKWVLAFSTGVGQKPRKREMAAGDLDELQSEIAVAKKRFGLVPDAEVKSCYEAGRDGFWLDRYLLQAGIDNLVVDSSSIQVDRKKRHAKTDRLDVGKLLNQLIRYHSGDKSVWSIVRPPSPEEEDRRQVHRELQALRKERTRTTNRIKGLLATQGVRLQGRMDLSQERLEAIRLWDDSPLLPGLKARLSREWDHRQFVNRQIALLERQRNVTLRQSTEADVLKVKQKMTLRGIGIESAWLLSREFGWRKFENRHQVGSLAGLTGTPFDSGESRREQGISKSGNRRVRAVAIELAWSWIRHQPRSTITLWFEQRFANAGKRARKIGIVAVARRLLIALWKFEQCGELPEGALLKA